MALTGRLDELSLPEILQLLSLSRKSGRLVLTGGHRKAVIVLREGNIVFAASEKLRDVVHASLGGDRSPTGHFVIDEELRREAREKAPPAETAMDGVLHDQIEGVVRDLLDWRTGRFVFDATPVPDVGGVAVDAARFGERPGVAPEDVLLRTLTWMDEQQRERWQADLESAARGDDGADPAAGEGDLQADISGVFRLIRARPDDGGAPVGAAERGAGLRPMVEEVAALRGLSSALSAELVLLVLRYAARVVARGVLFARRKESFQGIGQFGLAFGDPSPDERVRSLTIPAGQPSILADAAGRGACTVCRLSSSACDRALVERLGGGEPYQAVAVPIVVDGVVAAVLYGDDLPARRPVEMVEGLEILVREVALAVERARLDRRLQSLEGMARRPD